MLAREEGTEKRVVSLSQRDKEVVKSRSGVLVWFRNCWKRVGDQVSLKRGRRKKGGEKEKYSKKEKVICQNT